MYRWWTGTFTGTFTPFTGTFTPPPLSGHRQRRSAADSCFITPWLDGGSHVVREAVSQSDAAPLFPEQPEEVLIQALLYATIVPVGLLPTGDPVPVVTIPQRRSLRIEPTHGSRPRGEAASLTGWITRWMVSMFNLSWSRPISYFNMHVGWMYNNVPLLLFMDEVIVKLFLPSDLSS